MPSIFLNNIGH